MRKNSIHADAQERIFACLLHRCVMLILYTIVSLAFEKYRSSSLFLKTMYDINI